MTNIEFPPPPEDNSLAERFTRFQHPGMPFTFANATKEEAGTTPFDKSKPSNSIGTREIFISGGTDGKSQDDLQRHWSPAGCPPDEVPGSTTYEPLVNLTKLVDCAPTGHPHYPYHHHHHHHLLHRPTDDLNHRFRGKDFQQQRDSSVGFKTSHESGETDSPAASVKGIRKRGVFSIADILHPEFGSKASAERKRARLNADQTEKPPQRLESTHPLRLPAVNPGIVHGMLERNPGSYLCNFFQVGSNRPQYGKMEKENGARSYGHDHILQSYQAPYLLPNFFYRHVNPTPVGLPLACFVPGKAPTPPAVAADRFSNSSGEFRSQLEILSNAQSVEKSSQIPGRTDNRERQNNSNISSSTNSNNNNRPPTASPPLSAESTPMSSGSAQSLGSADKNQKSASSSQVPQKLWPAWVYCTRYSDRPSSGPRTRKPRKKSQKATGTDVKQTSSSSSSSSSAAVDDKRPRTAFNQEQLAVLKREFTANQYLTEERRMSLSASLGLNESQIKIWFQNKRAKLKKSSGIQNRLALELMAQGLYNHSTLKSSQSKSGLASPSSSSSLSRSPAAC